MATYPVRLGYVGVGGYGEAPLRGSSQTQLVEIVGVYDLAAEVAEAQAERYQCKVWDSYEQLLDDDAVDGVVLTLPPDENRRHVEMAAAAGKHCYVAKPIAVTVAEARAMRRACEEAGVVLMVGHNDRRRGEVRQARRLIEEGKIGQPLMFEGNFSHLGGFSLTPDKWRAQRDRCPVVPLMMLGIHVIDSMIYLLGPATTVKAFHRHAAMPVDNEDLAMQIYELECGALAYVGDSYCSPYVLNYRVLGTEGVLTVDLGALRLQDRENNVEDIAFAATNPECELMEELARAIVEGIRPETDAEAAIAALACAEGAIQSARTGDAVRLAEIG